MCVANSTRGQQTQQQILDAALPQFAERGYAATSIQDIAEAACVAKPALYYHFGSKAGLFRALLERVEDKSFQQMLGATQRGSGLSDQLVEVCASLFELAVNQREVIRLTLGHSPLAQGEVPPQAQCPEKARRRFAVIEKLMRQGLADGTFRRQLNSGQLALGFLGMVHFHIMLHLANPQRPLTRRTAEALVFLFLKGAAAGPPTKGRP